MVQIDKKRYNTLSNYYKSKYGKKAFKISLNGDFTCPNIDGKVGYGGCIYCSELNSGDFAGKKSSTIDEQFNDIKSKMSSKWKDGYYIPYFQANTNTYGSLKKIRSLIDSVKDIDKDVVMISLSTRCDCLDENIISYLGQVNKEVPIQIELGLQSSKQESLDFLNRCHNVRSFTESVKKLRNENIEVVVHIINGIPNETKDDMINTVKYLNSLDIQGVKIHMLHVMKNTKLGKMYVNAPFPILSLEEYVDIVVSQLRLLQKDIVIHRVTGDSPRELLIEPKWTLKKLVVMNEIDKKLNELDAYQGDQYDA